MPIESASRFSSAWVCSSIQCRSSKITISGWLRTLTQQDAFDRVERAPRLDLRIHLRERIVAFYYSQQAEEVGQRIFERALQRQHSAGDLFAPRALVIVRFDLEITMQQIDDR